MTLESKAGGGHDIGLSSLVENNFCDSPGTVSSSSWHHLESISSCVGGNGAVFTGVWSSSKSSTNIGLASSSVMLKDCSYIS